MRHFSKPVLMVSALLVAVPAAAQVTSPGPAWHSSAPIPAPGGMVVPSPPPPMVSPNPPHMRPGVPTAGARVWQNGRWTALPPHGAHQGGPRRGNRWGGMIDGRWYAGAQAPGGWRSYRRLGRGHHLPAYWMGSSFRIPDYLSWGLAAPPAGYFWVRYYDDAVLVDGGGNVWDSVGGIAWADADAYADAGDGYAGAWSNSYSQSNVSVGAGYRQPIEPVDPNDYYEQYPGGYAPPPAAYAPPPAVQVQGGYGSSYYGASGYYGSGAYHYGAPVGSTVVITMPATTTTTTVTEEVIEESVATTTYVRSAPRRVVRKPVKRYRPKPKVQCCVCVVCR